MPFTWDDEANAGYLSLWEIQPGEVARTVEVEGEPDVLVDLDSDDHILGVEFLTDAALSTRSQWDTVLGSQIGAWRPS